MYRKITAVLMMLLAAGLIFAGGKQEETKGTLKIGISKIVTHPALDALEQGIVDVVTGVYPDTVFDLQSANGEMSTAASIARKFKAEKVDIAVGIATPTAQALAQAISDRPVIFCAVTDPVDAGLITSTDAGEGNITGSSDMTPVKEQIKLLLSMRDISALGHVYTNSESNAVRLAEITEEVCAELGIEFVGTGVTNSSEVKQAAQTIAGKVDAFYISNDNTVVSAISAVIDVAQKAGIPIVSADTTSAENGGVLLAFGFDYYKMGRATGELILEVIAGAEPESIPTLFMGDPSDFDLLIDTENAAKLGIEVPAALLETARTVQ